MHGLTDVESIFGAFVRQAETLYGHDHALHPLRTDRRTTAAIALGVKRLDGSGMGRPRVPLQFQPKTCHVFPLKKRECPAAPHIPFDARIIPCVLSVFGTAASYLKIESIPVETTDC